MPLGEGDTNLSLLPAIDKIAEQTRICNLDKATGIRDEKK